MTTRSYEKLGIPGRTRTQRTRAQKRRARAFKRRVRNSKLSIYTFGWWCEMVRKAREAEVIHGNKH